VKLPWCPPFAACIFKALEENVVAWFLKLGFVCFQANGDAVSVGYELATKPVDVGRTCLLLFGRALCKGSAAAIDEGRSKENKSTQNDGGNAVAHFALQSGVDLFGAG
jgi:hypothetical protein